MYGSVRTRPRRTASDRDDNSRMKDKIIESSEQSVIKKNSQNTCLLHSHKDS